MTNPTNPFTMIIDVDGLTAAQRAALYNCTLANLHQLGVDPHRVAVSVPSDLYDLVGLKGDTIEILHRLFGIWSIDDLCRWSGDELIERRRTDESGRETRLSLFALQALVDALADYEGGRALRGLTPVTDPADRLSRLHRMDPRLWWTLARSRLGSLSKLTKRDGTTVCTIAQRGLLPEFGVADLRQLVSWLADIELALHPLDPSRLLEHVLLPPHVEQLLTNAGIDLTTKVRDLTAAQIRAATSTSGTPGPGANRLEDTIGDLRDHLAVFGHQLREDLPTAA